MKSHLCLMLLCVAACSEPTPKEPKPTRVQSAPQELPKTVPTAIDSSWSLGNDGLRAIRDTTVLREEDMAAVFPECSVDYRREKGQATAHLAVECDNGAILDLLLPGSGTEGKIRGIRVFRGPIRGPSNIKVGNNYSELQASAPGLVCRGDARDEVADGVIYRSHTKCWDPTAKRVMYIFPRVVFDTGSEPTDVDSLKISELRWVARRE